MTTAIYLASDREQLHAEYRDVRSTTMALCAPLEPEDMVVQTMPDVSPTKWHLAHVTWFFEVMVLAKHRADYTVFDEQFLELFNSYYQALGRPYPRSRRGLVSRPTVKQVCEYCEHVDEAMSEFLATSPDGDFENAAPTIAVGLNHEQQHQELLLMDIQHVLAQNPLRPAYRQDRYRGRAMPGADSVAPMQWRSFDGGKVAVGSDSRGFAYDNERPRHHSLVEPFEIASRPVTAGEFLAFMADGGYARPELWLADGWDLAQRERWRAPLYWEKDDSCGSWRTMTLNGSCAVAPREPVCHVSYFEADATPDGPAVDCRPRSSGSTPPKDTRSPGPSSSPVHTTRGQRPAQFRPDRSINCSATCGSGPAARTRRIPATVPSPVTSASTMANS